MVRTLRFSLTYREADAGSGMSYHPLTGQKLAGLVYDPRSRRFLAVDPPSGWGWEESVTVLPRIASGHRLEAGKPYPRHWLFDPYTGARVRHPSAQAS